MVKTSKNMFTDFNQTEHIIPKWEVSAMLLGAILDYNVQCFVYLCLITKSADHMMLMSPSGFHLTTKAPGFARQKNTETHITDETGVLVLRMIY